jgi:hypothetical protein
LFGFIGGGGGSGGFFDGANASPAPSSPTASPPPISPHGGEESPLAAVGEAEVDSSGSPLSPSFVTEVWAADSTPGESPEAAVGVARSSPDPRDTASCSSIGVWAGAWGTKSAGGTAGATGTTGATGVERCTGARGIGFCGGMTTTSDGSSFFLFFCAFFSWQFESQLLESPDECPDELLLEDSESSPEELSPDELLPEEPLLPDELLPDELLPDELLPEELHPVMSGSHANARGLPNRAREARRTAVAPSIRAIFMVPSRGLHAYTSVRPVE